MTERKRKENMESMDLKRETFARALSELITVTDPVHGIGHVKRVESLAFEIGMAEGADMDVVLASAWLHDIGDSVGFAGKRKEASLFNADMAVTILRDLLRELPMLEGKLDQVHHAIHAHSFSAGVRPETLEAMVLRDADRIDAIGAIGIVRWAMYSARIEGGTLAHPTDPFAGHRNLDDRKWHLDHIRIKLLTLADGVLTPSGRELAAGRHEFVKGFLEQIEKEWR